MCVYAKNRNRSGTIFVARALSLSPWPLKKEPLEKFSCAHYRGAPHPRCRRFLGNLVFA